MSGNTPTTSTTATCARNTSRRSGTWSTGTSWQKTTQPKPVSSRKTRPRPGFFISGPRPWQPSFTPALYRGQLWHSGSGAASEKPPNGIQEQGVRVRYSIDIPDYAESVAHEISLFVRSEERRVGKE